MEISYSEDLNGVFSTHPTFLHLLGLFLLPAVQLYSSKSRRINPKSYLLPLNTEHWFCFPVRKLVRCLLSSAELANVQRHPPRKV